MENKKENKTKTGARQSVPKKNVNNNRSKEKKKETSTSKGKVEPFKKIVNADIISKLVKTNLHHVLKQILSSVSLGDLTACRVVSSSWHGYLAGVYWVDKGVRRTLEDKLDNSWQKEKHRRVEVKVEGAACRENCSLNYKACDCPLLCQVAQNALVILFGATNFRGTYMINDNQSTSIEHDFGRPQYQVRISLKLDLLLDTSNLLWKPVFHKKQIKKTRLLHDGTIVEVDDTDKTFLLLKDKESNKIIRRVQPYTGWGDSKPITAMSKSSGRLALLISGRVFVYSLTKLVKGSAVDECLLLVGTRQSQPPVDFIHLEPHCLLTAGGGTVVLFNFWTDKCSSVSEFFT